MRSENLRAHILFIFRGWKTMETVTSRKHPAVQSAAALKKSSELRAEKRLFLAEGARLCEDAAKSGVQIAMCFFTEEAEQKYARYLEPVLACAKEVYRIAPHIEPLLSDTKRPQGVFCVCAEPEHDAGKIFPDRLLVLENLQDPSNLGNIFRTAEALGVGDILLAGACCEVFSPKVVRASMGAAFRLRTTSFSTAEDCVGWLRERSYISLAAVPGNGEHVTGIDFQKGKTAVWIGNEGNGLSEDALRLCEKRVTIPMAGRAESLNASTAAAILLWEMVRPQAKGEKNDG